MKKLDKFGMEISVSFLIKLGLALLVIVLGGIIIYNSGQGSSNIFTQIFG